MVQPKLVSTKKKWIVNWVIERKCC